VPLESPGTDFMKQDLRRELENIKAEYQMQRLKGDTNRHLRYSQNDMNIAEAGRVYTLETGVKRGQYSP